MKVLHVLGGPLHGGAGRAVEAIHRSLLSKGVESDLLMRQPDGAGPLETAGIYADRLGEKALLKLCLRPGGREMFAPGVFGANVARQARHVDVVNLHWINGAGFTVPQVAGLPAKVVWTLHDMWAFTGGCHYALDCRRFESTCGACPSLGSRRARDLSTYLQRRKAARLGPELHVVAVSRWLERQARASRILGECPIQTIPNIVDTGTFHPEARAAARAALGLDPARRIVLFGHASQPWLKGSDLLGQAMGHLAGQDGLDLVCFGKHDADLKAHTARHFGRIEDDALLRRLYSAADVFVVASRQEAFGRTIAEAMACGTPVVAFAGTGPDDIIEPGINGYLAAPGDPASLAEAILRALENSAELGAQGVAHVQRAFSGGRVAQDYIALYERLLAGRRASPAPAPDVTPSAPSF